MNVSNMICTYVKKYFIPHIFIVPTLLGVICHTDYTSAAPKLNPATSHYYDFIVSSEISWTAAKSIAEGMTFAGPNTGGTLIGYLATITSEEEESFLQINYGTNINVWIGASDATVEGEWRWVTGPEASADGNKGLLFWIGGRDGTSFGYQNWQSREPNSLGVNEDFIDWNHSNSSQWNDIEDTSPRDPISGFIVEFGGLIVPEPSTLTLAALGLLGVGWRRRKQV